MFFLLFSLFHIYFFANPYGFAYTAMGVVGLFMLHSMVFFWHRYELTALGSGRVTIDRPRQHYDDHRSTAGSTRFGIDSSSQGTSLSHSGPIALHPESPPRIRGSSQERVDFQPIARPQQLSATNGQLPDDDSYYRLNANDRNETHAQSSNSGHISSSSRRNFREDDEDSSSFVSFMQGEVVLRRGQPQNHMRNDSSGTLLHMGVAHALTSTNSGHDIQHNAQQDTDLALSTVRQPLMESFSSSLGLDLTGQFGGHGPDVDTPRFTLGGRASDSSPLLNDDGGDDSVSGLQSILEVRLTPRHRNGREPRESLQSPLPIFPSLPP
jgi:hypothetical protein